MTTTIFAVAQCSPAQAGSTVSVVRMNLVSTAPSPRDDAGAAFHTFANRVFNVGRGRVEMREFIGPAEVLEC